MKIKKIFWRNITSYGNKVQCIDFENNPGFYMLIGENGTGKSSFLSCITFALYGKIGNKKLKDIANRRNQNGWVKIELECNEKNIVIERGVSPSLLEVYIDGKLYSEAGKRNVQEYLEDEIYGMSYHVFDNLVSLNVNSFKSFVTMTPSDKRLIIDKLFSLDIINRMRELLKTKNKELKESFDVIVSEIDWITDSIEKNNKKLNAIKQEKFINDSVSVQSLNDEMFKLNSALADMKRDQSKIASTENSLKEKITEIEEIIRTNRYNIKSLNEKKDFFNKDLCPTCEREMHIDFNESKKSQIDEQIRAIESSLSDPLNLLSEMSKKTEKIRMLKSKLSDKMIDVNSRILSTKKEIDKIKSMDENIETKHVHEIIKEDELNLNLKRESRSKTEARLKFYKIMDELLSDKGVKQAIIENIIPALNAYSNEFCAEMNSDYVISFDSEFNVNVFYLSNAVPISSLSTGEIKKIDIIVLLSMIRLMKMKFPVLNVLFLDEIFSSIDMNNVFYMVKSLGKITRDLNLNTIVVNHSNLPHEEFDCVLKTSKNNGFSSIELEKINK